MRVIAFDCSGSNFVNGQKMTACAATFAKPRDIVLTYDSKVKQIGSYEDFKTKGSFKLFSFGNGGLVDCVFRWMDNRFISHLDELFLFADLEFEGGLIAAQAKDLHYQTHLIDQSSRTIARGPELPDKVKIYKIGDFDNRYRLLPQA